VAPNPPAGAIIDYWVYSQAARNVRLDIFDSRGGQVRTYRAGTGAKYTPDEMAERTQQGFCALSSRRGMHRFVWDLRYAEPVTGVLASPGRYEVRLRVDRSTQRAWFRLLKDPRVHVSDAILIAQFNAERFIKEVQHRVDSLKNGAFAALKHLANLRKSGSLPQRVLGNRLAYQIVALLDSTPVADPDDSVGPPERSMNTINYVSMTLHQAETIVGGYDHAPPPYAIRSAKAAARKLDTLAPKLKQLLAEASAL